MTAILRNRRLSALLLLAAITAAGASPAGATILAIRTAYGTIPVRLFDTATPLSVQNFLDYIEDGDFDNTFLHRSIPGFIIQGGGYGLNSQQQIVSVQPHAPVQNEPGISNVRGTLSYAKIPAFDDQGDPIPGGGPNSATSGWFINVDDNNTGLAEEGNLDLQNGGFTAFGRVLLDGMTIVDHINSRRIANLGSPFTNLPVLDSAVAPVEVGDLIYTYRFDIINTPLGDYNFDGLVDAQDYSVWREDYGSTTRGEADGNGDGVVNEADLQVWLDSYGAVLAEDSAPGATPEPGALSLMLLLPLLARRCRNR